MIPAKRYVEYFNKHLTFSDNEFSVIDHPFFVSPALEGKKFNNQNYLDIKQYPEEMRETITSFPLGLRILYFNLTNDEESNINKFTFFKLDQISERKYNYDNFFDIGLQYAGMGHVLVLSYYPSNKKFFIRMDGGSNGYEREANYNYYKSYDPTTEFDMESNIMWTKFTKHKLYNFDEILDILKPNESSYSVEECIDNS